MESFQVERGTVAGGISVLMVFLTLCVAIYSLLSLLIAENELSLNQKNRDATIDYYTADALATITISNLASAKARDEVTPSEDDPFPISYSPTSGTASFSVPIDKFRRLDVSITFQGNSGKFVTNRYCVVNNLDWQEQAHGKIIVITEFE